MCLHTNAQNNVAFYIPLFASALAFSCTTGTNSRRIFVSGGFGGCALTNNIFKDVRETRSIRERCCAEMQSCLWSWMVFRDGPKLEQRLEVCPQTATTHLIWATLGSRPKWDEADPLV